MHHSLEIMFILPLMTGHLFWKATILNGFYRGIPLYMQTMFGVLRVVMSHIISCWFVWYIYPYSIGFLHWHYCSSAIEVTLKGAGNQSAPYHNKVRTVYTPLFTKRKESFRKISRSLEAARIGFKLFQSLWKLTGTPAAQLRRCLSNFRAIRSS